MSLLLKNLSIITVDEKNTILNNGCIGIRGKTIDYIGEYCDKINDKYDRILNLKGRVAMPGFVNTHNHTSMSLFRNYADDMKLMDWLYNKIFPLEEKLTAEEIYWGSLLAISEMLRTGTTTFCDMYMFMDRVGDAADQSGIKASLGRGISGDSAETMDLPLQESIELYHKYHNSSEGRIRVNMAPHSVYTCTPAYLEKVAKVAQDLKCEIQIHLSENDDEVDQCIEKYHKTPVELVEEVGLLSSKTIAAHCVVLNEDDIEIIARNKVNVAHNPSSNMKLGSGIAPIKQMMDAGINMTLGTDGPSSNNSLDMLKDARTAAYLQKALLKDPTAIKIDELLKILTINGAKALGYENTGMLKVGYRADIIIFDIGKPWYYPIHNIKSSIIYSGSSKDVETVLIDGKIVMENYELLTLDEEKIFYEVERLTKKLKN